MIGVLLESIWQGGGERVVAIDRGTSRFDSALFLFIFISIYRVSIAMKTYMLHHL